MKPRRLFFLVLITLGVFVFIISNIWNERFDQTSATKVVSDGRDRVKSFPSCLSPKQLEELKNLDRKVLEGTSPSRLAILVSKVDQVKANGQKGLVEYDPAPKLRRGIYNLVPEHLYKPGRRFSFYWWTVICRSDQNKKSYVEILGVFDSKDRLINSFIGIREQLLAITQQY